MLLEPMSFHVQRPEFKPQFHYPLAVSWRNLVILSSVSGNSIIIVKMKWHKNYNVLTSDKVMVLVAWGLLTASSQ